MFYGPVIRQWSYENKNKMTYCYHNNILIYFSDDTDIPLLRIGEAWDKMKLNEPGRQTLSRKKSFQQAQHTKLCSGLPQAWKDGIVGGPSLPLVTGWLSG